MADHGRDFLHFLLRVGTGALFLQHGLQKLFGLLGGMGGSGASAELFTRMGVAGVLEFFGGLLIIAGLLTRWVAFVLVLEMIAAYVIAHVPRGLWPIRNGGELALLYLLVFAFLARHGAGPLSVDGWLKRRPGAKSGAVNAAL